MTSKANHKQITLEGQASLREMINAIESKFLNVKRQRCVRPKMENVLGYIPNEQHNQVYPELRSIFYQENLEKAEQTTTAFLLKYDNIYPTACDCLSRDLNECTTFYQFPQKHWRYIRTSNSSFRKLKSVAIKLPPLAAMKTVVLVVLCGRS